MNFTRLPVLGKVCMATLAAACIGTPAFALTPEQPLSMLFEEPVQTTSGNGGRMSTPVVAPARCAVAVQVLDTRRNKASFGGLVFPQEDMFAHAAPMYAESIRSGDGVPWLRGAMKSLPRFGVQAAEPAAGADAGAFDVALKLAHAWTGGLNMHSHVMLEVSQPGRPGDTPRRIHGFGTKTNWGGTNSEYMTVMNLAMNDAAQQLASGEFAAQCAGKAP